MSNLEQFGTRIPDVGSVILIFSLTITFYLTKAENGTKKISNTAFILLLRAKVLFLLKNTDISKIKRVLVLKDIFSKATYVFVLTYQVSSFLHYPNKF